MIARDQFAEDALIHISRAQRESKWTIDANEQWVQRPMIRERKGNGQIEIPVNEEPK